MENKLIEIPVDKIKLQEASSFTYAGKGRYLKQPKVELIYNGESYFILDRKVCYNLIKQFEPNITWTEWVDIQNFELSLYKILDDYFKEYSNYIIKIWVEKYNDNGNYLQIIYDFETEDPSFGILRLNNIKASVMYMSIEALKDWVLHTVSDKITISKGDNKIEIQEYEKFVIIRARKYVENGFVQTMPATKIMGIIETMQWYIVYETIIEAKESLEKADNMESRFWVHDFIKNTANMKTKEKDDIEHEWFLNSFY